MSAAPALRLDRVSYEIGGLAAKQSQTLVSDVSFSVQPGEIAAIVGPNGAGKTTLIRMIAGLIKPTGGTVFINGTSMGELGIAERAQKIAYVGQTEEPDGRLTVAHYVALGLLPHARLFQGNVATDQTDQALAETGLISLADRRMDRLSGGERQKAKIARALCQRPRLLVLDEPTNHLDPQARGELLGLVASIGIPVVAALHDLTLIDAFADKVAIINEGCLLGFGTPAETLTPSLVQEVFKVELHRLPHPESARHLSTLNIPISRANRPMMRESQ